MRKALVAVLLVGLVGCGVEVLTTTAIQGELQAENMKALKGQVANAAGTMGKVRIENALSMYYAENGFYPASLDYLVPGYLPSVPAKPDGSAYGYDPDSGKLVDGPAAGEKMQQIRTAVDNFGRATGYYPGTLYDLVPNYLAELPRTASGQDFGYDPQTGAVYDPSQAYQTRPVQGAARQGRGTPTTGAGPMGEAMTGIGMQNQLNSTSNSGTNSAGGYARNSLGNSTGQHQRTQEKVLNELGF